MSIQRCTISCLEFRFGVIRRDSELAIRQVDAAGLRRSIDGDSNSIAIILKHVGGNLRSRFTNFLSEDGEKPWRDREAEFVDDFPPGEDGRAAAIAAWTSGWKMLESTLAALNDGDLQRHVRIRGERHTVLEALVRSTAHVAYHQGQITLIARILVGRSTWTTISIPRGGTAQRHAEIGFDAGDPARGEG